METCCTDILGKDAVSLYSAAQSESVIIIIIFIRHVVTGRQVIRSCTKTAAQQSAMKLKHINHYTHDTHQKLYMQVAR